MISIDSHENFSPWAEKSDTIPDYKCPDLDLVPDFIPFDLLFPTPSTDVTDFYDNMDLGIDINNLDLEKSSYDFTKSGLSPIKVSGFNSVDDYFLNVLKPVSKMPDPSIMVDRQYAPLSPDSGIEQDGIPFDECADVFGLIEKDKDVDGLCDPVTLKNDSDLDKYLEDILLLQNKTCDTDDEIFENGAFSINLSEIIDNDYNINQCIKSEPLDDTLTQDFLNGFDRTRNDSISSDHWLNEGSLNPIPNEEDFSALCASLVLQPVKKECTKPVLKEDTDSDYLFVLRSNSKTIQIEHSYCKQPPCVVESDEDDEPVKKRKRNDVDEDFSPYQKPKRKVGRPRTNFSRSDSQKTQRSKMQKNKALKRTTQASKKLKSCSSVPFDRREQHNQAERERRDMLKRNLDIVEDITPDHVLQLTQIALQSEKTTKSDELENNENNFTVDVLKKLDELIKKEPVSHRPKYKKASRNSKMVVLLGSTYYIGSLEKELKLKESRLAQLKKQYEDCLKRLNPSKSSSKKIRRNY